MNKIVRHSSWSQRIVPSLAILAQLALVVSVVGQTKDPYLKTGPSSSATAPSRTGGTAAVEPKQEYNLGLLFEYLQVDHRLANQLLRKYAGHSNANQMRDELEGLLDKKEATLLETSWVPARSGQRAKVESIEEIIYATEWTPPEVPTNVSLDSAGDTASFPPLVSAASPSQFETRNVGTSIEVDPVLNTDKTLIDLNLAPEIVQLVAERGLSEDIDPPNETSQVHTPVFHTMRVTTQVTVTNGNHHLLTLLKPYEDEEKRILLFVRVDIMTVPDLNR